LKSVETNAPDLREPLPLSVSEEQDLFVLDVPDVLLLVVGVPAALAHDRADRRASLDRLDEPGTFAVELEREVSGSVAGSRRLARPGRRSRDVRPPCPCCERRTCDARRAEKAATRGPSSR